MLVGYGMATAAYPAHRAKASAEASLLRDGTALIRSAGSDMGPGTYTSMTQVAAEALGLPVEKVRFELGDTEMPFAPVHGGSITMASVGTAVQAACQALLDDLAARAPREPARPLRGAGRDRMARRRRGPARGRRGRAVRGAPRRPRARPHRPRRATRLRARRPRPIRAPPSGRCSRRCGSIPISAPCGCTRLVGAYDIGRVVNPKTARSQCIGGMVGGVGMALLEQAEWDERFGRPMNRNLAEYLVPVCADIRELDVAFVPSEDPIFNPLGVKGVAELGLSGVAAAIGNAVYHATGRRVRSFPILPESLL